MAADLDAIEMRDAPAPAADEPSDGEVCFPDVPDQTTYGGPLNTYSQGIQEAQARRRLKGTALLILRSQGYSRKEIAKMCGMTPNAVRQALSNARKQGRLNELRSILEHDSLALAVESLNHHLLAKDKDATFKTLEGLGQFRSYAHNKHEGGPAGFVMPALQVNIVTAPAAPGQAPAAAIESSPLGVARDDAPASADPPADA